MLLNLPLALTEILICSRSFYYLASNSMLLATSLGTSASGRFLKKVRLCANQKEAADESK
jgi:hypothetical protein